MTPDAKRVVLFSVRRLLQSERRRETLVKQHVMTARAAKAASDRDWKSLEDTLDHIEAIGVIIAELTK